MELDELSNEFTDKLKKDSQSMHISPNSFDQSMSCDDIFQFAKSLKYGELHFKMDQSTGLFAVIAVNSTKLGPAIGGCRCISYPSISEGIIDAIRLAHMMAYKAAICGLPHGGAKAVLIKPPVIVNRTSYLESFAEFVTELNGRYVTAIDSGTDVTDMDIIATRTPFVTCTTASGGGDPSPYTALGVKRGIEAAVKFKLGRDNLKGIHVAIQGAGHVGYNLAKFLHEAGATLTMTDHNLARLERCEREFGVTTTTPDKIMTIECDVFSPCALGSGLNEETIPYLKTAIVAGAANNQLKDLFMDDLRLLQRGILYAPDFLINAGGLIQAASVYDHGDLEKAVDQIHHIYDASMDIFTRAQKENKPTHLIAQTIAEERLS